MTDFSTTPPRRPVIGMKALTNSGEHVTLFDINDELFFSLFWERVDGSVYATDPAGRGYQGGRFYRSIERWEILPQKLNEGVNNSQSQEN